MSFTDIVSANRLLTIRLSAAHSFAFIDVEIDWPSVSLNEFYDELIDLIVLHSDIPMGK